MAEAFRIERLLLIRQILQTYPIGGDENPLRADFPDGRDRWSADLRLARALDDLDGLFEALRRAAEAGPRPPTDSPPAGWLSDLVLRALAIDAEIRAGFDAIR